MKRRPFINFFYQDFERHYNGVNLTYLLAKEQLLEVNTPSLRQLYNWIKKRRFKITKKHLTYPIYYRGRRRKKVLMKKIFDHYIIQIKSLTMDNWLELAWLGILTKEMNFKVYAC